MKGSARMFFASMVLLLAITGLVSSAVPAYAADKPTTEEPQWTIYFRPAVRWGTDDRTLFIMDFLVPLYRDDKNILFINPKYTPNDLCGWEVNVGLGYRHIFFDKVIVGANVFYDKRKTSWGTFHEQVGTGIEAMTEIHGVGATLRFNYYWPLSDEIVYGGSAAGSGLFFREEGIYRGVSTGLLIEEPLEGFDAELGIRVPYLSNYVETWVYGGGYSFYGDRISDSVDGWSARLEVIPTDFVRLSYEYRQDRINNGEHYGEVALEVPFSIDNLIAGKNPFEGFGKRLSGSRTLKDRLVEPVRRDVDIVVVRENVNGGPGSVDPTSGELEEEVIFVSDAVLAGGNGMYELPYDNLTSALNDSRLGTSAYIVHVMHGDGGGSVPGGMTWDEGGDTTRSLLLWGAGVINPDYPDISNLVTGAYPIIADTLTLNASYLHVMGLSFGSGASPISGNGVSIIGGTGITLDNNRFYASDSGIYITGGDDIHITNNTIASGSYGIRAEVAGDLCSFAGPLSIGNNTITVTSPSTGGHAYGIGLVAGGNLYANGSITGNTINVTGIYDSDVGGKSYGIYGRAGTTLFADISGGNTITATGDRETFGIDLVTGFDSGGDIGSAGTPVTVTGNALTVRSTEDIAYGIALVSDDNIEATINGNTMNVGSDRFVANGVLSLAFGTTNNTTGSNTISLSGPVSDASRSSILNAMGVKVNSIAGLQTELMTATAGDFIFLRGGSYTPGYELNLPAGVTLWGQGVDPFDMGITSSVASLNSRSASFSIMNNIGSNSSIWGVTFDNPSGYNETNGLLFVGASPINNVALKGTTFDRMRGSANGTGLAIWSGATVNNLAITGSTFTRSVNGLAIINGTTAVNGLYVSNSSFTKSLASGYGFVVNGATVNNTHIFGSTFSGNTWAGVGVVGSSTLNNFTMEYCGLSGNTGEGLIFKGNPTGINLTFDHLTVANNGESGLMFATGTITGLSITNSSISGNGWENLDLGVAWLGQLLLPGSTSITGNTFTAGPAWASIYVESNTVFSPGAIVVSGNNIVSGWGLGNAGTTLVNAENNWWGSVSGPGSGGGTRSNVYGNVDFNPYATSPF